MIIPVSLLFIFFSLLFIIGKSEQESKSSLLVLLIIWVVLSLIAAFRPENMADRDNYLLFWHGWGEERFEIGFSLFANILKRINSSFYFFLFASAALSVGIKLSAICRITPLIWGTLVIYISNLFVLHDMIQIRCAIASGLLLHAVYYIVNKDLKSFIIVSSVAFLCHYSAAVIFPLWFLNAQKTRKIIFFSLIILSYTLALLGFSITNLIEIVPIVGIQNRWTIYQNVIYESANIFGYVQLCRIAICIFIGIYLDAISVKNKYAILLWKIYVISISVLPLCMDMQVVAYRVSQFYQVVEFVLIPMIIYVNRFTLFFKRLLIVLIGLSFLLMTIYVYEHLK